MATACSSRGTPVVMFNRYVPGLKVAAVCCDNVAGSSAVADYIFSSGHARPAYVAGESDATTNLDRARGFSTRLQELGIKLHTHEIGGSFSYERQGTMQPVGSISLRKGRQHLFRQRRYGYRRHRRHPRGELRVPEDIS